MEKLKHILAEVDKLPLKCSEEVQLRNLIQGTEDWVRRAAPYVAALDVSANDKCSDNPQSQSQSHQSDWDSAVLVSLRSESVPALTPKLSVVELNDLLWVAKACPLPLPNVDVLEGLYESALCRIQTVREFLDSAQALRAQAAAPSARKPRYGNGMTATCLLTGCGRGIERVPPHFMSNVRPPIRCPCLLRVNYPHAASILVSRPCGSRAKLEEVTAMYTDMRSFCVGIPDLVAVQVTDTQTGHA